MVDKESEANKSNDGSSSNDKSSSHEYNFIWEYLAEKWPDVEDRPKIFQDPSRVKHLSIQDVHFAMKNEQLGEKKALNKVARDVKPPSKTFEGGEDNCADLLLDSRFERYPIVDPSKWYAKVPLKRKSVFKNMPLKFFGGHNRIADITIAKAHDRTNALQLKHYLCENNNVSAKPKKEYRKLYESGVSTITDDWWEAPTNLNSVQAAFDNYATLLFVLWPYDPTSIIFNNLLTTYKWVAAAPDLTLRLEIIKSYFNSVLKDNSGRAINDDPVMCYEEHETLFKSILARNGLRPEIPFVEKRALDDRAQDRSSNSKVRKVDNKSGRRSFLTSSGQETCRLWNSTDFKTVCRNPLSGNGCSYKGKVFPHVCSAYMVSKSGICEQPHRRKDHR